MSNSNEAITSEALIQAAQNGEGLAHLTPGEVYAAIACEMRPSDLQKPMSEPVKSMLQTFEDMARIKFFGGVMPGDTDEMIRRAYDETQAPFLAIPLRQSLESGMRDFFPGLKPDGVTEDGQPVISLEAMARHVGVSVEYLKELAEEKGVFDQLTTTPAHKIH